MIISMKNGCLATRIRWLKYYKGNVDNSTLLDVAESITKKKIKKFQKKCKKIPFYQVIYIEPKERGC